MEELRGKVEESGKVITPSGPVAVENVKKDHIGKEVVVRDGEVTERFNS